MLPNMQIEPDLDGEVRGVQHAAADPDDLGKAALSHWL